VNAVYGEFYGDLKPARCIIPIKELDFGLMIEMDTIAYV